jgi:Ca-activated chloride channel homolog
VTFARPELLALALLAPVTAAVAAVLWRRRLRAAEAWASRALWGRLLGAVSRRRLAASVTLLALAVLGAGLALAQPRWGESVQRVERRGIDVVLVLDASLSMGARDLGSDRGSDRGSSRLAVAETLVRRLVQAMPGNRVALLAAEGDGVVMAPLTTDAAVIDLLLDGIEPGSLPVPGTRLADSLDRLPELYPPGAPPGASIGRGPGAPSGDRSGRGRHRAAILISDGEDHGGALPESLARLAEAGIVVHTLGVGTPDGAPVPIPGMPGAVRRRRDGSVVISRLREDVLETVARETGGVYLRARDPGRDLEPVLSALDTLEKTAHETAVRESRAERFQWPLALAVAALLAHLALSPFAPRTRRASHPVRGAVEGAAEGGA